MTSSAIAEEIAKEKAAPTSHLSELGTVTPSAN